MNNITSRILGTGAFLPPRIVDNHQIAQLTETSDEWIQKRTGITQRHFVDAGVGCGDLAAMAGRQALDNAGVKQVDALIVATTTPDNTFPATAARVHQLLQLLPCPFFDIQAVCAGFVYALNMADNMIKLGQARHILVIGAEVYSKIISPEDRNTFVLFGDGAGAVVLGADTSGRGILTCKIMADGQFNRALYVDGGVVSTGSAGIVRMDGQEVFRHAVEKMSNIVQESLQNCQLSINDIDWLIPHQANWRIMAMVADKLQIPHERVIKTVQYHANISAATIPFALHYGVENGMVKANDIIAMTALGGGFAWGGAIVKY